jgi:hypothetical protein
MACYLEWESKYENVLTEILPSKHIITPHDLYQKYYKEHRVDSEWLALINIQNNIMHYTFKEWLKYIDFTLNLLINESSDNISELPYHNLWVLDTNPLDVAIYAMFNSNIDLPTSLSKTQWMKSYKHTNIMEQINNIIL